MSGTQLIERPISMEFAELGGIDLEREYWIYVVPLTDTYIGPARRTTGKKLLALFESEEVGRFAERSPGGAVLKDYVGYYASGEEVMTMLRQSQPNDGAVLFSMDDVKDLDSIARRATGPTLTL
jgi:hypothetical protein